MAAHFFDIDGTIVNYHTSEWLDGAKEHIYNLYKNGNQIFFITMRCNERDSDTIWSVENTKMLLKDLDDMGVKYHVIFNVHSPRIIHDDSQILLDRRITNQIWKI